MISKNQNQKQEKQQDLPWVVLIVCLFEKRYPTIPFQILERAMRSSKNDRILTENQLINKCKPMKKRWRGNTTKEHEVGSNI